MRKIINDPVHGFITIDDELIYQIISHPYYQRLRRIKQMALAYLVYPGAVHTRLHHSLGAYHLMCKAIDELIQKKISITEEESRGAKIAILLHDIGHGPFSHALENTIVDAHHEDLSLMIMQKLNQQFDGQLSIAIEIFQNKYPKLFLHQLVSSQLDVDRLDYLARDSFFTGVSEGIVGYERIIKMLTVHNGGLVVEEKGIHSIEKFLISRRFMYWQVYLHKTVLSSELMLVKILERAKYLTSQGASLFSTPALHFFLTKKYTQSDFEKNDACLENFLMLDDSDLISAIKVWETHDDKILSDLCNRLSNRNLLKIQFLFHPNNNTDHEQRKLTQTKYHLNDEEMSYYFIETETSNKVYNDSDEPIFIYYKNGSTKPISEVENTLITSELLVPTKKHYICYLR